MKENKLIAQALLEIAQRAETTFIEVSKEDKELISAAKKIGIELPSPDLMVMKTVYAEIDKVNKNGVILPRKAVEKGLKTLIGKQCNWEHDGAGFVCGYTIDAKINGDKIETINVLFKSLFPDQADELKSKVKSNEAAVSFEIWNIDPETKKSVVRNLDNGFMEIAPIIFHGTGVLLIHQPACPKAKIFKLIAKKSQAEKIEDRVFSKDLIFASLAFEKPECKNCGTCNCEKEGDKVELTKLFENIKKEEEITFDIALSFYYASNEEQAKVTEEAAKWTRKFINNLPDSAFAAIEPAYPEKTQDKNARHLPHHNGEGDLGKAKSNANLDLPHYKNALARVNQINPISDSIAADELRTKASAHLERHKDALEKASELEKKTETPKEEQKQEVAQETPKEPVQKPVDEKPTTETPKEEAQKLCPECKEPMKKDEELCSKCKEKKEKASDSLEPKAEPKAEETKTQVAETKPAEEKADENKEEKPKSEKEIAQPLEQVEPKIVVKVTRIYSEVTVDTYVDGTPSGTQEVKGFNKKITEYSDGTKDEVTEEVAVKKTYDFAELEEKVNATKAEYEAKLTEKETENKTLKAELDTLKAKTETLPEKEEETPSETEINLGAEIPEEQGEIKRRVKEIDTIIASKHTRR